MKGLGTGLVVLSSVLLLSSTMLTAINKDKEIENLKEAKVQSQENDESKNIDNGDVENNGNVEEEINDNENSNIDNTGDLENNETINVPPVTVQELDNVFVIAKEKFADAILTDEIREEMDKYFTEVGRSELQGFYVEDTDGTKICTDVVVCNTRDNAFTKTDTAFGEMTLVEVTGDTAVVMLKVAVTYEDGSVSFADKYRIVFKYESDVWKINNFAV